MVKAKAQTGEAGNETTSTGRRQALVVTAAAGPRRRAGLSFGPVPRELYEEDLGDKPDALIELLRADPYLKIDLRRPEEIAETEE